MFSKLGPFSCLVSFDYFPKQPTKWTPFFENALGAEVSAFSFKCRPSRAPRLDRDGFVLSSSFGSRSVPPGTAQCAAAETAAPRRGEGTGEQLLDHFERFIPPTVAEECPCAVSNQGFFLLGFLRFRAARSCSFVNSPDVRLACAWVSLSLMNPVIGN